MERIEIKLDEQQTMELPASYVAELLRLIQAAAQDDAELNVHFAH